MSQSSPTTAKKLIAAGCNFVEELRLPQFMSLLSEKQRAKVRYMGHLERNIEREDAEDVLVSYDFALYFCLWIPCIQSFCRQSLDSKFEITLVGD